MTEVESIVSAYKHKRGMRFDREVAESLNLPASAFSNYMKGRRRLPDIAMVRIAEDGDMPLERVIAATNVTFLNTPPEEKAFWTTRLSACQRSSLVIRGKVRRKHRHAPQMH